MAVLPVPKAKKAVAHAYEELQLAAGASEEQVVARFRSLCLQRVLLDTPATGNNAVEDAERFQRQAVAYRFLSSLPLLGGVEYSAEKLLPTLKPLSPQPGGDERHARASALLDVSIASMERAQPTGRMPYTNFVLRVHYCLRRHVVRRRYSEFLALHRTLEPQLPVLPQLPERHWVYALRTPPAERARRLAGYLQRIVELLAARGLFSLDVMAFLEVDVARVRAEEEALAIQLFSSSPSAPSGSDSSIYYIVHGGWVAIWKKFVTSHEHPPGSIANAHLLEPQPGSTVHRPKDALEAGRHYRCVNGATWRYWHRVYGGGPAIRRQTPSIYGRPACDVSTLAALAQRLVRGFLARRQARRERVRRATLEPETRRALVCRARQQAREERLATVRQYVEVREFQARHMAALRIQRAFRAFVLRSEHSLLLRESVVPDGAAMQKLQQLDADRLALEELALVEDPELRLAHFVATLFAGVPLRKMRARHKPPRWRLFRLNAIASELHWSSVATPGKTNAMAFVDVETLKMESPLRRTRPGLVRRASLTLLGDREPPADMAAHAVVATYTANGVRRELMLLCESRAEMEALHFGLSALVTEATTRTAHGATYVDGHGVIRKRVPHAKRLLQEAQVLLEQQYQHK